MVGPTASKRLEKPYLVVDGGLPDYMSDEEDLYSLDTFQRAEKYLLTTQFEWEFLRDEAEQRRVRENLHRNDFIKNRKTPLTHLPFCTILLGAFSFPL